MKKLISLVLVALTIATLCVASFAAEAGKSYGNVPVVGDKITIDGKKEAIWSKALTIKLDQNGDKDIAEGTVSLLWNGKDTIYVLFQVKDATPYIPTEVPKTRWNTDYCEIFLDYSNKGARAYDQYLVDRQANACLSCGGTYAEDTTDLTKYGYMGGKSTMVDGGYILEMELKAYKEPIAADMKIGMYANVVDRAADGASSLGNSGSDAKGNKMAEYGYITLVKDVVKTEVTTAATQKTPAATGTSAATADASVIIAVVAAISGSAVVITKKRK